jgi:hypothetical protein
LLRRDHRERHGNPLRRDRRRTLIHVESRAGARSAWNGEWV